MTERFSRWIVHHPWTSLLMAFAITLASMGGMGGYQYSVDHEAFFGADNPQLMAFKELQGDYSRTDTILMVLVSEKGDVFTQDFLRMLEGVTRDAWQIPYAQRVESLTNYQRLHVDEDDIDVNDLVVDQNDLTEESLADIRRFAMTEPFLAGSLVSDRGDVAGVRLTLALPGKNAAEEVPAVVMPMRELADKVRAAHPDVKVHLVGQVIADQEYPEASQADFVRVWPGFLLTLVVVLSWLFRSIKAMIATLVACTLAVIAGAGVIGYLGLTINDAVIVAPIMILTLGLADCIHLIVGWMQSRQKGMNRRDAMADSLHHNMIAMTVTSALTVIGFLTLHFNDSPPFQVMGYIVAVGVTFALLFTFLVTAPLLVLVPSAVPKRALPLQRPDSPAMSNFAGWVVRSRVLLLAVFAVVGGYLSFASLQDNQINDDIVKYYTEETTFRQSMVFVNDYLTGTSEINYSLLAPEGAEVTDPAYLHALAEFSDWLKQQPDVVQVNSLVDIIRRVNQAMHNDDPAFYKLPDSAEETAQYLLQYEMSLPYGMDLNYLLRMDHKASRMRVAVGTSSGQRIIALDEAAQVWQQKNWPEYLQTPGASLSLMFAHIGERSIAGMFWGLIGSLALASLLLWIIYGRWIYALACFVGNLLPIGMAYGVWGLRDGNIDLGMTVVLGIVFSVVVDDTVHFINKYDWHRRAGFAPVQAVYQSFLRVGFALITTSVVLGLGFAWLGNSAIQLTVNTAFMICLSIVFALAVDLLVVPSLLSVIDRKKTPQTPDQTSVEMT